MNWHKLDDTTLESVPARYIIKSYSIDWHRNYIATDTLLGGIITARRGIATNAKLKRQQAINELKQEVADYDRKFG